MKARKTLADIVKVNIEHIQKQISRCGNCDQWQEFKACHDRQGDWWVTDCAVMLAQHGDLSCSLSAGSPSTILLKTPVKELVSKPRRQVFSASSSP